MHYREYCNNALLTLPLIAIEEYVCTDDGVEIEQEHSPGMFLSMGLELEDMQRRLEVDVRALKDPSANQKLGFTKRRTTLLKRIYKFREIQRVYMPSVRAFLSDAQKQMFDGNGEQLPENTRLFMPSEIADSTTRGRACAIGLAEVEARLREAEAGEALEAVRQGLRTRTMTNRYKLRNFTGQGMMTKGQGILRQINIKIHIAKLRYRYSRAALLVLRGHGVWEDGLRVLADEDVRALNERALTMEEKAQNQHWAELGGAIIEGGVARAAGVAAGEGSHTLSWIWYTAGATTDDENDPRLHDALRVEWCKAFARTTRFSEEIRHLREEMRRTVAFGYTAARKWDALSVEELPNSTPELTEGRRAYAAEHADTERRTCALLEKKWAAILRRADSYLAGEIQAVGGQVTVELEMGDELDPEEEEARLEGEEDGEEGTKCTEPQACAAAIRSHSAPRLPPPVQRCTSAHPGMHAGARPPSMATARRLICAHGVLRARGVLVHPAARPHAEPDPSSTRARGTSYARTRAVLCPRCVMISRLRAQRLHAACGAAAHAACPAQHGARCVIRACAPSTYTLRAVFGRGGATPRPPAAGHMLCVSAASAQPPTPAHARAEPDPRLLYASCCRHGVLAARAHAARTHARTISAARWYRMWGGRRAGGERTGCDLFRMWNTGLLELMQEPEWLHRDRYMFSARPRSTFNAMYPPARVRYIALWLQPLVEEEGEEMVTRGGENMREVSWIWTVTGTAGTDAELEDALRIEWAKAWARSRRWTEEVRLLEEEWRRLPVTYAYRENVWVRRAIAVPTGKIPAAEAEGMLAYASKQAQLYRDLAEAAERTRTEPHLKRGAKRRVFRPAPDPIMPEEEAGVRDSEDEIEDDGEDDDERGDVESDEELLMGGEVDED
ncbi:hypothetical protein B0H11DRAFT_1930373 [Mycena galericulata]|nr:hypothetical protein B0H11DRAFT_1930373 [Mycena galericulata]